MTALTLQISSQSAHADHSLQAGTNWIHYSTADGDLESPGGSNEQTASLIADLDGDGKNDFVIGARGGAGPSLVWYQREAGGWSRHIIESAPLSIEAGGAVHDIDGDGDLDIVMGGDYQSNQVWWWENPAPAFDSQATWTRRLIKNSGQNKHHDQIFGDFDGDGQAELFFWNQSASALVLAEIPDSPRTSGPWPQRAIYAWSGGADHEGFARADVDGDGLPDLIGGGRWFKYEGDGQFTPNVIDDAQRFARAAAGQLVEGGPPEVVFVAGDGIGPLKWYRQEGDAWIGTPLLDFDVDHGHSLDVADMDGDGFLDIFVAEMRLNGGNEDARMWIFFGDGRGNFTTTEIAVGYGNHESRVADLDGDGDLDVLGKPYNWETPRLDIWLNQGSAGAAGATPLDRWERHVIDDNRPGRAIFITAADLNGDGLEDIVSGGWWYENPGAPGGAWTARPVGDRFGNLAVAHDFDRDGDVDLLGTQGQDEAPNSAFVWARNDGRGTFEIFDNIQPGQGDFLQGVTILEEAGQIGVALSWHEDNQGVQLLRVPAAPDAGTWTWEVLSPTTQNEDLSSGDIDGDGDPDLLLGTRWLESQGGGWTAHTLFESGAAPDRNELVDIDGDGRLDAVVGYEAISRPGTLAWYRQPADPTARWTETLISEPAIIGPMSVDAADMDGDGDVDVVAGEHNTAAPAEARLFLFENSDGSGGAWTRHEIGRGDEHHDGAQLVDIDGDGDLDVISIGWTHNRVLLYENLALSGGGAATPTPPAGDPSPAPEPTAEPAGGTTAAIALYTFDSGSGDMVLDRAIVGDPLNLRIGDPAATSWLAGRGLALDTPTLIASETAAQKITTAVQRTGEISLEAWIRPASVDQEGPARIATLSADANRRNFTLGQGLWDDQPTALFDVRLRTTTTDENGQPSLSSADGSASATLTHLVYTFDRSGEATLYINGEPASSRAVGGTPAGWSADFRLGLANELSGDRPWLGTYYLFAVYDRALPGEEVTDLFTRGAERTAHPGHAGETPDAESTAPSATATVKPDATAPAGAAPTDTPTVTAAPPSAPSPTAEASIAEAEDQSSTPLILAAALLVVGFVILLAALFLRRRTDV